MAQYVPAALAQVYDTPEYLPSDADVSHAPLMTNNPRTWTKNFSIEKEPDIEVRGDFQVGPAEFTDALNPGEQHTEQIQLTNRQGSQATYTITMEDFAPGDDKNPIILYNKEVGPYSARSWLAPAARRLQLEHGERAFMPVRISVPANASAGDHYVAVVISRDVPPSQQKSSGFVAVSRVAALFLITVKGDIVRDGQLDYFRSLYPAYWSLPIQFEMKYTNTGTVHVIPQGTIEIRNIFGVAVDEIPMKDWVILRGSSRLRQAEWNPTFALGYYRAVTHFQADTKTPIRELSTGFWVVPVFPLLIVLFVIFLVSLLVQLFMNRFEIRRRK